MNGADLIVVGLYGVAWLITTYQAYQGRRGARRTVGAFVLLIGVGGGFLTDVVPGSPLPAWVEILAALLLIIGIVVLWSGNLAKSVDQPTRSPPVRILRLL